MALAKKKKSERILAFDILRGIFLLIILVNHVELYPSIFDFFTGRGRLFVSAAEGFFFLSGLLVSIVYRRRIAYGMRFILFAMWRRAVILYFSAVGLALLFTAWGASAGGRFIKDGLPPLPIDWPALIVETLRLQYNFGWADFLPHYAVFMIFAPLVFWLLLKGKWWVALALSIAVWAFRGDEFTPAWQLIFMTGMIVGYHWEDIKNWYMGLATHRKTLIHYSVFWVTAVTFIFTYTGVYVLSFLNAHIEKLPDWAQSFTLNWNVVHEIIWRAFSKWTLGPGRVLLFYVWFLAAFYLVVRYEKQITKATRGVVTMLGQNSLFVYVTHAFIIFTLRYYYQDNSNIAINFLVTLAAVVLICAITYGHVQLKKRATSRGTTPIKLVIAESKKRVFGTSP